MCALLAGLTDISWAANLAIGVVILAIGVLGVWIPVEISPGRRGKPQNRQRIRDADGDPLGTLAPCRGTRRVLTVVTDRHIGRQSTEGVK